MNNKGFTLVELLATLVVLAIVMSIGTVSIIAIVNSAKEKNYTLLINNIKSAAETYYQECKYSRETIEEMFGGDADLAAAFCDYDITLGELVTYGYIKGNKKEENGTFKIVNPKDESDISECSITVSYQDNKVVVSSNDPSCPAYN